MKTKISNICIDRNLTIKYALKQMDEHGCKLLIVTDAEKFFSLISIGDIQRSIINDNDLNLSVDKALRKKVTVAYETDDIEEIKQRMKIRRNEFMPVLTKEEHIKDVIFWEDLFEEEERGLLSKLDMPVVIMAGGKGSRLKPLTNILPKALIPIGEKTILERIMDSFIELGSNKFYISVNYKSELIEYYLNQLDNSNYQINYFKEEKPLGTAGSLHLLKEKINETFVISNCDILIDQDYSEIVKYHIENRNEITVVAAIKHYPIPYGVLNTGVNGLLRNIEEKPELSLKINTGFYIVEPGLVDEIPVNKYYNITDLINKLKQQKRRIGVFPVSEKSWTDIGTWNDYLMHQGGL